MIPIIEKRFGFKFGTFIFSNPRKDNDYDQVHFISYEDVKSDYYQIERRTPVFNLDQPLEKIFSKFNKTTRNEINRTLNDPRLAFDLDSQQYDDFHNLYVEFERRKKRLNYILNKNTLSTKSKLFMACIADKPVAAILCYDDNKILRARIICSRRLETEDSEIKKLSSYATRRLVYEICKYGINNGYKMFDMGEICDDPNDPAYSISQFKLSFGGEIISNFHYYKIINPWLKLLARAKKVKYF